MPAGHVLQPCSVSKAGRVENFPLEQCLQLLLFVLPGVTLYVPAAHAVQVDDASSKLYLPAGQM